MFHNILWFCCGFCIGAVYAYIDTLIELKKRLADGRLIERVS